VVSACDAFHMGMHGNHHQGNGELLLDALIPKVLFDTLPLYNKSSLLASKVTIDRGISFQKYILFFILNISYSMLKKDPPQLL